MSRAAGPAHSPRANKRLAPTAAFRAADFARLPIPSPGRHRLFWVGAMAGRHSRLEKLALEKVTRQPAASSTATREGGSPEDSSVFQGHDRR